MPAKLADDGGDDRQTISSRFGDTDGVITSSKGHLVAGPLAHVIVRQAVSDC